MPVLLCGCETLSLTLREEHKLKINSVFWEILPCGPCKEDVLEEIIAPIIRVTRIGELKNLPLLGTAARYEEIQSEKGSGSMEY
jgi:hypothetical protein